MAVCDATTEGTNQPGLLVLLVSILLGQMVVNGSYCAACRTDSAEPARARIATDYVARVAELTKPPNYDPNADARSDCERAEQSLVKMPEAPAASRQGYPTDWTDETRENVRRWIAANEQALTHLARGARKPYYRPVYRGKDAASAGMPELAGVRTLVFVLNARIKMEAFQGREQQVLFDVETLDRFGRHFGGRKYFVHQLVGVSVRAMMFDTLSPIVARGSLSTEAVRQIQRRCEGLGGDSACRIDLACERLIWLDYVQRLFTDEGNGRGRISRSALGLLGVSPEQEQVFLKLGRRETTECIERFFESARTATGKTPWQLHNEPNSILRTLDELRQKNVFVDLLGASCLRALELSWRTRIQSEAVMTVAAAVRYERDRGQYPASLDLLVSAGYLRRLPRDFYSDGKSLVYRRSRQGFLLYSRGVDFDDDGGTPSRWGQGPQGGDEVFWPVPDRK